MQLITKNEYTKEQILDKIAKNKARAEVCKENGLDSLKYDNEIKELKKRLK